MVSAAGPKPKVRRWTRSGTGNPHGGWSSRVDDGASSSRSSAEASDTEVASSRSAPAPAKSAVSKQVQASESTGKAKDMQTHQHNESRSSSHQEPVSIDELVWDSLPPEVCDLVQSMEAAVKKLRGKLADVQEALELKQQENTVLSQKVQKSEEAARVARQEASNSQEQVERQKRSFDSERVGYLKEIQSLKQTVKAEVVAEPPSSRATGMRGEVTRLLSEKDARIAQLESSLEATQQQLRAHHADSNTQLKSLNEKLRVAQSHSGEFSVRSEASFAHGPDASDMKARLVTAETQAANALQRAEATEQAMENSLEENRRALANAYKETALLQQRLAARESEEQEVERRLQELQIALDRAQAEAYSAKTNADFKLSEAASETEALRRIETDLTSALAKAERRALVAEERVAEGARTSDGRIAELEDLLEKEAAKSRASVIDSRSMEAQLGSQLQEWKSECEVSSEKIQSLEKRCMDIEASRRNLAEELVDVEASKRQMAGEIEQIRSTCEAAVNDSKEKVDRLSMTLKAEREKHKEDLAMLEDEKAKQEFTIMELQRKLSKAESWVEKAEQATARSAQERVEADSKASADLAALRNKESETRAQLLAAEKQLAEMNKKLIAMRDQQSVQVEKHAHDLLEAKNASAEAEATFLAAKMEAESNMAAQQRHADTLKASLAAREQDLGMMQEALADAKLANEEAAAKAARAEERAQAMREELEASRREHLAKIGELEHGLERQTTELNLEQRKVQQREEDWKKLASEENTQRLAVEHKLDSALQEMELIKGQQEQIAQLHHENVKQLEQKITAAEQKAANYLSTIEMQKSDIALLQEQLEASSNMLQSFYDERAESIRSRERDTKEKDEELLRLQQCVSSWEERCKNAAETVDEYRKECEELRQSADMHNAAMANLEALLSKQKEGARAQIEQVGSEITDLKDSLEKAHVEIGIKAQKLRSTEEMLVRQREEQASLKRELAKEEDLAKEADAVARECEERVRELESLNRSLRDECESIKKGAKDHAKALTATVNTLESEHEKIQEQLEECESQLNKKHSEAASSKRALAKIRGDFDTLQQAFKNLEEEKNKMIDDMQESQKQSQDDLVAAEKAYNEIEREKDALTIQLAGAQDKIVALTASMKTSNEEHNAHQAKLQAEIQQLETRADAAEQKLVDTAGDLDRATARIQHLEELQRTFQDEMSSKLLAAQNDLATMTAKADDLCIAEKTNREQCQKLLAELASKERTASQHVDVVAELRENLRLCEESLAAVKAEALAAKGQAYKEHTEQQAIISTLTARAEQLEAQCKRIEGREKSSFEKSCELEAALSESTKANETLSHSASSWQQKCEKLQASIERLQLEVRTLEEQATVTAGEYTAKREELKSNLEARIAHVRVLEATISAVRDDSAAEVAKLEALLANERKHMTEKAKAAREELESLKKSLFESREKEEEARSTARRLWHELKESQQGKRTGLDPGASV